MTIVSCPRCRDEVTVPAKASRRAIVRCPLCLEQYSLAEALADMPPALIVVEDAGASEEALTPAGTATAEGGGIYQVAGGVFDSSPPAGATVSPARPAARPAPRPKRKEKSAIVELVKVVLGGLVGLTLGYVILMWFFNMDPGELGPKVSPYAPWIVPTQFRGKAPAGTTTAGTEGAATAMSMDSSGPSTSAKPKKQPADEQASELGNIIANQAVAEALKSGKLEEKELRKTPHTGAFYGPYNPNQKTNDSPMRTEDSNTFPNDNPLNLEPDLNLAPLVPSSIPKPAEVLSPPAGENPTTSEPAPDAAPSGPTSADLQTAIDKASDTLARLDATPRDQIEPRQKLYSELYDDCSEVGRIVSHLDPMSPEVQQLAQSLQTLLGTFAANEGKISAIRHLATQNLPERGHDQGIMLTGTVQDFSSAGFVHEMAIETSPLNMTTAKVICRSDPQQFCRIGDGLIIVGRIVEEPQKNLAGYEGNTKRAVFLGFGVPIAKKQPPPPE